MEGERSLYYLNESRRVYITCLDIKSGIITTTLTISVTMCRGTVCGGVGHASAIVPLRLYGAPSAVVVAP